jgi:hypothetical protein
VTLGATTSTSRVEGKTVNGPPSFQLKLEEIELTVPDTLDIDLVKSSQSLTKSSSASVPKKRAANTMPDNRATKRRAVNQEPPSNNAALTSRDEPVRKKRGRPPKVASTEDWRITTPISRKVGQDAQAVVKWEPIEPSLDKPLLSDSTQRHDTPIQHKEADVATEQEVLDLKMDWEDMEEYSHTGKPITQMALCQESEQSISNNPPLAKAPTESRLPLPKGAEPRAWAQVFVFSSLRISLLMRISEVPSRNL